MKPECRFGPDSDFAEPRSRRPERRNLPQLLRAPALTFEPSFSSRRLTEESPHSRTPNLGRGRLVSVVLAPKLWRRLMGLPQLLDSAENSLLTWSLFNEPSSK